ncbi:MAG: histidinol-phosphate transaminase [Clostridia bacterium]|nr:histidinol-phosphate transaminase [Clostridia bacterium]
MSKYLSERYMSLKPYEPGEQPQDRQYLKLNTNESPFPPPKEALDYAQAHARSYELYSDPESVELRQALAERYQVPIDMVMVGNGSDEVLNYAFMAFGSDARPALFPDVTYGFYKVFADVNRIPYKEIPVEDDLTIRLDRYAGRKALVVFPNPNAPTGIFLPPEEIARLAQRSPDSVIMVDEAYVDFGGTSCIPLTLKYQNLLIVQTFSKSRSLAGARIGFCVGAPQLIRDLQTIRYSVNPYNMNAYTQALGIGVLGCEETIQNNCRTIIENRAYLTAQLKALGFSCTDSLTNFVFARHPRLNGRALCDLLRDRGVLVRHFNQTRISQYNRITVGTKEQIDRLIAEIRAVLDM